MKILYKYTDGTFQCPFYGNKGEKLSVRQYEDEWGCRIGKAFMLGDSAKEAIENTIRYLGNEPVDAESVEIKSEKKALSDEDIVATKARIESLSQSANSWSGSKSGLDDILRKIEAEKAKLK